MTEPRTIRNEIYDENGLVRVEFIEVEITEEVSEEEQIKTVNIWKDSVSKTAELFSLRVVGDDLATSATFYYELKETDGEVLATGNLVMVGTDYSDWNATTDANTEAYNWAAAQLNLTII